MHAQAVIFDLDDTIIVEESFARASLRAAVAGAGLNIDDVDGLDSALLEGIRRVWRSGPFIDICTLLGIASWEGLWASFDGGHPMLDGLRQWVPTYRVEAWRVALEELGVDDPDIAVSVADAYVQTQRQGHPLIPGAAETIRTLAEQVPLGLLTNGPPDIQRFKLERTGLGGCFTTIGISGELGVGKPSRAAFAYMLDALRVGGADAVMIGDSWERDVEGALNMGLDAVWISSDTSRLRDPRVAAIESVGDVKSALEHLGRR